MRKYTFFVLIFLAIYTVNIFAQGQTTTQPTRTVGAYIVVKEAIGDHSTFLVGKKYSFSLMNFTDEKSRADLMSKIQLALYSYVSLIKEGAVNGREMDFMIEFSKPVTANLFAEEMKKINLRIKAANSSKSSSNAPVAQSVEAEK